MQLPSWKATPDAPTSGDNLWTACRSGKSDVKVDSTCTMQRIFTIALLLLSLTFLGQARVEPFACGSAVVYSSVNDVGCQKGCCTNSSCCKAQRTAKATPIHSSVARLVNLDWFGCTFSLTHLALVVPIPTESVEPSDAAGYAPPVLATICVRLVGGKDSGKKHTHCRLSTVRGAS